MVILDDAKDLLGRRNHILRGLYGEEDLFDVVGASEVTGDGGRV